ncbi:MAG: 50S ribosomal protein L11 methyltransferase [Chloracidobacterium sp.]|nr:50S ribosomal protein L11 methyltransferase [Chloracidobacterium sp.]
MTHETWFAVDVTVSPEAAPAVEEGLAAVSDLGTSLDSLRKHSDETVVVTGFLSEIPDITDVRHILDAMLAAHGLPTNVIHQVAMRTVENADWLAEWKRHWQPTEVGHFIVSPPWLDPDAGGRSLIRIDPNMAFGTGTHETTQLCLEAISDIYTPDQSVLDIGTGTGILAIATAKIGATNIIACDTDADSVEIARDNAAINGVANQIRFFHGSIDRKTPPADLVCANLTLDVITPMLPLLLTAARHRLLLSGILAEQGSTITDQLNRSGITDLNFEIRRKSEWIAVIVSFPAS